MRARNLAFEIGTEEIPSAALYSAKKQLHDNAIAALAAARLSYGEVRTYATPRRLILVVTALAEASEARTVRSKGPSVKAAFDAEGNPTKAAEGFARGKGVTVSELEKVEENGVAYVYAVVEEPETPAMDVLPAMLESLITSIDFKKSQRWGTREERFSRPVRWLFALYGPMIVSVTFAGLKAGRLSRGHRLLASSEFSVASAEGLIPSLENVYVIPHIEYRELAILNGIKAIEARLGARAIVPAGTLAEVVNLVEYPTVVSGTFDEEFLKVPREIITDAMLSHQRYFPVEDADGALTNHFIVVHNGDPLRSEMIVAGHERVIRARLSDAAFFYHEDLKKPLDKYVPELESVVFQEKLGTVAAKVNRILGLTGEIAALAQVSGDDTQTALRAAFLCKADLVTSAVVEFTSLQGVMGGYYALESRETPEVATAIVEHYRPKFAGDELPCTTAGRLVALADKLDTICGIFAIGQGPTGSSDPFALRRAAIGVINIMLGGMRFDLDAAIDSALGEYVGTVEFDRAAVTGTVREFFAGRLESILKDRDLAYDTIAAILATGVSDPTDALAHCIALQDARTRDEETFDNLAVAFARANNLRDAELGTAVDESLLGTEERDLLEAITAGERDVATSMTSSDFSAALAALASLRAPIDTFFEAVLIMDPDEAVRANRMRLLNRFVSVFDGVVDLTRIGG